MCLPESCWQKCIDIYSIYINLNFLNSRTICLEEFLDYLSLVVDKQFEEKGNLCAVDEEKKVMYNGQSNDQ